MRIQGAVSDAAVVSVAEGAEHFPPLVIVAMRGTDDRVEVVEQTCQVLLDELDGPDFSYLVILGAGSPAWFGSTVDLGRCPPP